MSNGPNWGLQCLFNMAPPVKVPAVYVTETSVICTAPAWGGQEGEPASKPVDPTAIKMYGMRPRCVVCYLLPAACARAS
jgi:hypothetical protein